MVNFASPPPAFHRGRRLARPKVAAPYLNIGLSTLWAWAADRDGFPKPIKAGPGVTLFDLDELDAYLTEARPTA